MAGTATFAIRSTLRGRPPTGGLPLLAMKEKVLGRHYDLSLVFIGDARSRSLNKRFRGKDKRANVLSFPLSPDAGEIFINPREAARQAKQYDMSQRGFIGFLFIHGMLHLKGHLHSSRMEQAEQRLKRAFSLK